MKPSLTPGRRRALRSGAALALACSLPAWSQPGKPGARAVTVAQIVDTSPAQQDVSGDFLIGSRAAWQDINRRGGLRGRPVQHLAIETDGSAASLGAALHSLRDNASCVALSGTAGDPAAAQLIAQLRGQNLQLAHVAPWLQDSSTPVDEFTFPIFAGRQEQIGHALKSLSTMDVQAIGTIYASAADYERYHQGLERMAADLKLKLHSFRAEGQLDSLGQRLTQQMPAVLLFIGGTPELVQFTRGLEKQARQRYVVALADVNLQTMAQMGAGRTTPVIATQAVPMLSSSLPVVRAYRDVLSRLFDEAPTSLGLAGFIAARYTFEVLQDVEGNLTRQSALVAFQRRAAVDLGGYRISYDSRRHGGTFVTQSMLTPDARIIG